MAGVDAVAIPGEQRVHVLRVPESCNLGGNGASAPTRPTGFLLVLVAVAVRCEHEEPLGATSLYRVSGARIVIRNCRRSRRCADGKLLRRLVLASQEARSEH